MTAEQFKTKYSQQDFKNAETFLYDLVSYLEETNKSRSLNSINVFIKAADALNDLNTDSLNND
jgi:hypothetical protein